MNFVRRLLPEWCFSAKKLKPKGVVIHSMNASNAHRIGLDNSDPLDPEVCWHILVHYKVSAHLCISPDGTLFQFVPEDRQAYHAGAAILNGKSHCNSWTLGIELFSLNDSFTDAAMRTLAEVLVDRMETHGFDESMIGGHDQVRAAAIEAGICNPRKVKTDPGPNFDWDLLFALMEGIKNDRAG